MRFSAGGKQVEPYTLRGHRLKDIDLFVANGLCLYDAPPCAILINFNGIFLDVLTVIEPLHGESTVKGYGLGKYNFYGCMMRSCRR